MNDLVSITIVSRAGRALVEAGPTLVTGVVLAGILRVMVNRERASRLFAGEGTAGLLRASLLATLIPVCSLGVLPIVGELRRLGVSTPKLLSFGLAAPMLNPITLVYGLTVLTLPNFLLIVATTLFVSLGVGAITSTWADRAPADGDDFPCHEVWGWRRMANVFMASSRIASGRMLPEILLVIVVCGIAALFVPSGFFTENLHFTDLKAPPNMVLITLPAYIVPATGVMMVGVISEVRFSLGAAVALHVFGVGVNAAALLFVARIYGIQRLISLGLVVLVVTLAIGYSADFALPHPAGTEDNTHALDSLTRPYGAGTKWSAAFDSVVRDAGPSSIAGLCLFGLLVVAGIVIRVGRLAYLEYPPHVNPEEAFGQSLFSKALPPSVLVGVSLCGLVALFGMVVYIYFPSPDQLFEDIAIVRNNAVVAILSNDLELANKELLSWDALMAKIPIAAALRGTSPEDGSQTVDQLRQLIGETRQAAEGGQTDACRKLIDRLREAERSCKDAYLK